MVGQGAYFVELARINITGMEDRVWVALVTAGANGREGRRKCYGVRGLWRLIRPLGIGCGIGSKGF